MRNLRILRLGLLVGRRDFSIFWTWKSWAFGWMLRILTNVFIWILLGRLLGSTETLQYLMVGFAATAGVGTWAVASGTWDRYEGTYPLLVVAPGSMAPAVIGRMSIWMFSWMASSAITVVVVGLSFRWEISVLQAVALAPLVLLLSLTTFFLAVFLGALASLAPRIRNITNMLLVIVISSFCGVSVPVHFWPGWIASSANLLPVTHGLAGIRLLLAGGDPVVILAHAGLELLVGLGWLVLALLVMDRLAERGRADGSIEYQ